MSRRWACGLLLLALGLSGGRGQGQPAEPFRLAFSSNMFTEVSLNDARAAMKVWMMTVAKDRDIAIDPEPNICASVEDAIRLAGEQRVDGFGLTLDEFARLARVIPCSELAVSITGGQEAESYVLLARKAGPVGSVEDLAGRRLTVLLNPRMSLALSWLDTVLLQRGQRPAREQVSALSTYNRTTQVVLPVFFGQADAALVTRRAFATMTELNPALGLGLRELLVSPPLIPSGFFFRADGHPIERGKLLDALQHMGDTPAGRQILTLTKSDHIELRPIASLDASLQLLAARDRLLSTAGRAP